MAYLKARFLAALEMTNSFRVGPNGVPTLRLPESTRRARAQRIAPDVLGIRLPSCAGIPILCHFDRREKSLRYRMGRVYFLYWHGVQAINGVNDPLESTLSQMYFWPRAEVGYPSWCIQEPVALRVAKSLPMSRISSSGER